MIERDLLQSGVAHAVATAVAHVDHPAAALLGQQRNQRGAHAAQVAAIPRAHEDGRIGAGDSRFGVVHQRTVRIAAGEQAHHLVDGE